MQVFDADGHWDRSFGTFGADLGQLKYPNAVASDTSGRIVVSDNWNHRLQVVLQIPQCPFSSLSSDVLRLLRVLLIQIAGVRF